MLAGYSRRPGAHRAADGAAGAAGRRPGSVAAVLRLVAAVRVRRFGAADLVLSQLGQVDADPVRMECRTGVYKDICSCPIHVFYWLLTIILIIPFIVTHNRQGSKCNLPSLHF